MNHKDYYIILGVKQGAGPHEIKEAYRQLAFKHHPDRNTENPDAAEKMKHLNEAYAVLSNPEKKREYDAMLHRFGTSAYSHFRETYTEQDIFSGSDIFNIFEDMTRTFGFRNPDEIFREFYGQRYRRFEFKRPGIYAKGFFFFGGLGTPGGRARQLPGLENLGRLSRRVLNKITGIDLPEDGADVTEVIHLTPEQALEGGPYAYFYRRQSKKLVVQIPRGIRHGQKIRLSGLGDAGSGDSKPGELYLKVDIKKPLLQKVKALTGVLFK
ncbi:MAG: J domain-containing protein [Deltaproteobacteria bacterium]|nr:J domain-containing protein [Deltaproteobacteria bacterium]